MEKLKENVSHRKIKEPGSAITHFIAMIMAIFAATPLIIKALSAPDMIHVISLSIFIGTMILLYAASTTYHAVDATPKINKILLSGRNSTAVPARLFWTCWVCPK